MTKNVAVNVKQIDLVVTKATTKIRWPMLMTIDWHWQSFWFGSFGFFFYCAPRWTATVPWLRIHSFHPVRSKMESFAVGFHRQMSSGQTTGKIDMSPNLPTLISIFGFLALASTQWFTIHRHKTKKADIFFWSKWFIVGEVCIEQWMKNFGKQKHRMWYDTWHKLAHQRPRSTLISYFMFRMFGRAKRSVLFVYWIPANCSRRRRDWFWFMCCSMLITFPFAVATLWKKLSLHFLAIIYHIIVDFILSMNTKYLVTTVKWILTFNFSICNEKMQVFGASLIKSAVLFVRRLNDRLPSDLPAISYENAG